MIPDTTSDTIPDATRAEAPPAAPTELVLELMLAPLHAAGLMRHPAIAGTRTARPRARMLDVAWFDTEDGTLAEAGLVLEIEKQGRRAVQRLCRSIPEPDQPWMPGQMMPVLGETLLATPLPEPEALAGTSALIKPGAATRGIASFSGRCSTVTLTHAGEPITLTVIAGTLRAVMAERPAARVRITGHDKTAVQALAACLAADLPLCVPATSLAEEARAVARSTPARPLRRGAPTLPREASTAEAYQAIISHLTLAMLGAAPAAAAGDTPEGVHQTRVALRRLRSALSLLRPLAGPHGQEASAALKTLANLLGPARDWDVFITGTLAAISAAFEGDGRVTSLARAAEAAREQAYAALREALAAPAFRLLGLSLASLAAAPHDANAPARRFAAAALTRRLKRVLRHGDDLSAMPVEALHELRLDAKRLRYAAEMFAPLFGPKKARRFLRALAAVQEELGHLNDAAVAAVLLDHLAARDTGRAFAIGVAEGWIAAKADGAREAAFKAWDSFLSREVFWEK